MRKATPSGAATSLSCYSTALVVPFAMWVVFWTTHEMVMREATLRKKAELDGLTGIFNREAAMTRIEKAADE